MTTYNVRLLGSVHIEQDGQPVKGLRSRKALALLCYLILRGTASSRTTLATLFWPDLPEPQALRNLSWVMAHLNSNLPGSLIADRLTVRFQRQPTTWVDLLAFQYYRSGDDLDQLEKALALYRGELLEGFYIDDCPDFEVWLLRQREFWQQQLIETFERVIQLERRVGAYRQALSHATRLAQLDPCREETHRTIMTLLALDGQRTAALAQYEVCRKTLLEELGVEPSEATTELYKSLRDSVATPQQPGAAPGSGPAAGARASHWQHLPSPFTRFIGREQERSQITELLRDRSVRLITLTGPGGIGKTRLAIEIAEQQRQAFRHGVHVIPLATVPSGEGLLFAVAEALQVTLAANADLTSQLLQALRARELLLVLDNLEHLVDSAMLLLELLYRAPNLTMLVTSRERLQIQPEHVVVLRGLELTTTPELGSGMQSSAVRLFADRARRHDVSFQLTQAMLPAVVAICQAVEGSPLGIELAATWINRMSCEQIAEAIARNADVLATPMRDLPERHRSLRAVFEHSWLLLAPDEQRAFRALSVFEGGWDEAAAWSVASVLAATLGALQDKSLLQHTPTGRYAFHELLRQYAQEQLALVADEREELLARHSAYYLELAEAGARALRGQLQVEWITRMSDDYPNFLALLQRANEREDALAILRLGRALWQFWEFKGYMGSGRGWLEKGLALARRQAGDESLRQPIAASQLALGSLLRIMGLYDEALLYLTHAYETFQALDDRYQLALTSGSIGRLKLNLGDFAGAQRYLEEQLRLAYELDDRAEIITSLNYMAILALESGNHPQARVIWQDVLRLATEACDYYTLAKVLNNLAAIHELMGEFLEAFKHWQQSLQLAEQHEFRLSCALAVGNLAEIYLEYGIYDQALRCAQHTLRLAVELNNDSIIAWILGLIAQLAAIEQDPVAPALYQKALELQRAVRSPYYLARVLFYHAEDLMQAGRLAEALYYASQAQSITCEHQLKNPISELRATLLVLRLQVAAVELSAGEAVARAEELRARFAEPVEQADIAALLVELDPAREDERRCAAEIYAALHEQRPLLRYRRGYAALTGQSLAAPDVPALARLSPADLRPFAELLDTI